MRALIDYRAALRQRSGVGEYTHQLTLALLKSRAPTRTRVAGLDITIFSSSWKDRVRQPSGLSGASIIDRRVPVSVLNFAWHRLEWPTAETRPILMALRGLLAQERELIAQRGLTLVGVAVTNLDDDRAVQLALPLDPSAGGALDEALDEVRERFGSQAITRAVLLGRGEGIAMPQLPD